MQSISKLSNECKKCPHVNDCDNKRMVACAMMEYKPNIANAAATGAIALAQPASRIENPITINMGVYGTMHTSLEEIAEKLNKDLYKNLNCSFNKYYLTKMKE